MEEGVEDWSLESKGCLKEELQDWSLVSKGCLKEGGEDWSLESKGCLKEGVEDWSLESRGCFLGIEMDCLVEEANLKLEIDDFAVMRSSLLGRLEDLQLNDAGLEAWCGGGGKENPDFADS